MRKYRARFGLKGFHGMDNNGNSGGLALYWHESVKVEVVFSNQRCIDAQIRLGPEKIVWRLTCVYGEPRVEDKHNMWTLLNNLSS